MSDESERIAPTLIMQYAWAYAPPMIIDAAIQQGIFDALDGAPKTAPEISAETGASERGVRALADALVGLELLHKEEPGKYGLTPESCEFLVKGKPGWLGGFFGHHVVDLIPKWLELRNVVKTGKPVAPFNQEGPGSAFFEHFVPALFPVNYPSASALATQLGIERAKAEYRVLDLAAGSGVWGIVLAQRSPQVRVTAVDWPAVIPVTRRMAGQAGVADRFTFVEGDMLSADLGTDHHLAVLGHILHSEGERRSRELLQRTFGALAPGGKIAIAEFLTSEDRTEPVVSLLFAVNMLVNTEEGTTFSVDQLRRWLIEAGFVEVQFVESPGPSPLVIAEKPSR